MAAVFLLGMAQNFDLMDTVDELFFVQGSSRFIESIRTIHFVYAQGSISVDQSVEEHDLLYQDVAKDEEGEDLTQQSVRQHEEGPDPEPANFPEPRLHPNVSCTQHQHALNGQSLEQNFCANLL